MGIYTLIFLAISLFALLGTSYIADRASPMAGGLYAMLMVLATLAATMLMFDSVCDIPENTEYYLPAEIVAVNEDYTFFGADDGNIYAVDRNEAWPNAVPYLLHMDSKGTSTVEDDEVLMVWRGE